MKFLAVEIIIASIRHVLLFNVAGKPPHTSPYFFQVSLRPTVLLNTGFSGVESGSTLK
jgi:hypothetical protein